MPRAVRVALVLCVLVAACGDGADSTENGPVDTAATATSSSAATSEATTTSTTTEPPEPGEYFPATVWVSHAGGVSQIDGHSGEVLATVAVADPGELAIGAGGVWIADCDGQAVHRFVPGEGGDLVAVAIGACPVDVMVAEGIVWVLGDDGTLVRVNPIDLSTTTVSVEPGAVHLAPGSVTMWWPDGSYMVFRSDEDGDGLLEETRGAFPELMVAGVYLGFDGLLYILDESGDIWSYDILADELDFYSEIDDTPVTGIWGDGSMLIGGESGVFAFTASSSEPEFRGNFSGIRGLDAYAGEFFVAEDSGSVWREALSGPLNTLDVTRLPPPIGDLEAIAPGPMFGGNQPVLGPELEGLEEDAVIKAALLLPGLVEGWGEPRDPSQPSGLMNPPRTVLSLWNPDLDFHPLFNPLVYK